MALIRIDDERLSLSVFEDGSFSLADAQSGAEWKSWPVAPQEEGPLDIGHVWPRVNRSICEQWMARFSGTVEGDCLRFDVLGPEGQRAGSFRMSARVAGDWAEFRILDIDESLPNLIFPPSLECDSLVIPQGVGRLVRKPLSRERECLRFYQGLNMRWFGGLRGDDAGWICAFEEGHCDAGVMLAEMTASPAWLKSLGKWQGPRVVRYRLTRGGYVGMAKAWRAVAVEKGLHLPLREKIDRLPRLKRALGGRQVSIMMARSFRKERSEERLESFSEKARALKDGFAVRFTHEQAAETIAGARAEGLRKGIVVIRGWIQGGYDESHPDIWPPDSRLGSIDALEANLRSNDDGPVVALHDNYQDIYRQSPSFPKGVNRRADGSLMRGGLWAGGQAYILNSRDSLAYAKRNWDRIRTLGPEAMFIDTTTAVALYESFEPGNELSRSQDEQLKAELLAFYKEQGVMLGSEEAADFGVPYVDWLETRHRRAPGESAPLWSLVFHDAVHSISYYSSQADAATGAPNLLFDMLVGNMAQWPAWRDGQSDLCCGSPRGFKEALQVDAWHEKVGADELLSHRWLDSDGHVEQTEFSSGRSIICNFSNQTWQGEGHEVGPRSCKTLD